MFSYIFINLYIAFCDYLNTALKNDRIKKYLIVSIIFILFFFQALRGNFTSDYDSYINRFNYYNFSFHENGFAFLLDVKDPLDALFHIILGVFTNNPVSIHIFYAIVTFSILVYFLHLYKNSINSFMFLFLFVNAGFYYTGFNISRQIIAAMFLLLVFKDIEKIKMNRFIISILIISLIHFSSIIFLFIGIILKVLLKNKKYNIHYLYMILFTIIIFSIIYNGFINLYCENISTSFKGYKITNLFLPVSIWLFIRFYSYYNKIKIDLRSLYYSDLYLIFCVAGLVFSLAVRFSYVFNFFTLIYLSKLLKINTKYSKQLKILIYFLGTLYTYITLSGTGYDPYYFI